MSSTNKTPHYDLSQFLAGDKASWIADINPDMLKIDTALFSIKTDATDAASNASAAQQQSQSAVENAQLAQQEAERAMTEVTKLQTSVSAIESDYTLLTDNVNQIKTDLTTAETSITQLQTDVQQAQTSASAAQSSASTALEQANRNYGFINTINTNLSSLSFDNGTTTSTSTITYSEVISVISDLGSYSIGSLRITTNRSTNVKHVSINFSIVFGQGTNNYIEFFTDAFKVNQIGSTSFSTGFYSFTNGNVTDGIALNPPTSNATSKRFTFVTPSQVRGPGIFYGTIQFQKTS